MKIKNTKPQKSCSGPSRWYWLGLLSGGVSLAAYLLVLRPHQLRWGASDEEVKRVMPGDEIVQRPSFNATRAVTVKARPEHIWPWLLQIGINRAGWYSYDIIDNLGRPSAREILSEYQKIEPGTYIPINPWGEGGFWVKDFQENRYIIWADKDFKATSWVWGLYPMDDGTTRLVSRVRMQYKWLSPWILFDLALDVGDIFMMRKCLLGIRERAEALAQLTQ